MPLGERADAASRSLDCSGTTAPLGPPLHHATADKFSAFNAEPRDACTQVAWRVTDTGARAQSGCAVQLAGAVSVLHRRREGLHHPTRSSPAGLAPFRAIKWERRQLEETAAGSGSQGLAERWVEELHVMVCFQVRR